MYPAIRLRIRTLRTSDSSETFRLLFSKSSVNSFGYSFASSIATRLMYVGRILPNDSLRVSSRKRSKGCVLNKGSEENADANRFRGAGGALLVSDGLSGQLLNRDLGYAEWDPTPHRPPGADDDGRIPRERRIPEELKQLHRPHPERTRRDARVPELVVRGSPRAGSDRSARGVRVVLIRRLSTRACVSR